MKLLMDAMEQHASVQLERDEALAKVAEYRTSADIDHGIKQQLNAELEAVRLALSQAQSVASGRMSMIYELSAQLSTLGLFATTLAGEVRRILDKVNEIVPARVVADHKPDDRPAKEPDQGDSTDGPLPDMVGPLVVSRNDGTLAAMVEGIEDRVTKAEEYTVPFAKRAHLLTETALPSPAFLHRKTDPGLPLEMMGQLTFRERKAYVKDGTVPFRLRR